MIGHWIGGPLHGKVETEGADRWPVRQLVAAWEPAMPEVPITREAPRVTLLPRQRLARYYRQRTADGHAVMLFDGWVD